MVAPLVEKVNEVTAELEAVPAESAEATGLRLELEALQNRVAGETANPGDTMRVIERAIPGSSPVSPRPKRDALLAFIGALVLGALAIYLRDLLFDRYRSRDEVAKDLGIPLVGEIPSARRGPTMEPFRSLRAAVALQLERAEPRGINAAGSAVQNGRSVLITGAESGCGKSFVTANLSRAFASEGRQVSMIDADLRRPTLHDAFDVPLSPGLSDLLLETGAPNIVGIGNVIKGTSPRAAPASCAWSPPATTPRRRSSASPPNGWRRWSTWSSTTPTWSSSTARRPAPWSTPSSSPAT